MGIIFKSEAHNKKNFNLSTVLRCNDISRFMAWAFLGDALKEITSLLIALVAGSFSFYPSESCSRIHFEKRRDYWRAFAVMAGVVSVGALAHISAH